MTRLFKRFQETSLQDPNPPLWAYLWLENHPTLMQRIAMAERYEQRQSAAPDRRADTSRRWSHFSAGSPGRSPIVAVFAVGTIGFHSILQRVVARVVLPDRASPRR